MPYFQGIIRRKGEKIWQKRNLIFTYYVEMTSIRMSAEDGRHEQSVSG
jgi:hypothetical protein